MPQLRRQLRQPPTKRQFGSRTVAKSPIAIDSAGPPENNSALYARPFTPVRRKFMRMNRSLGLTLVAAALVVAYGCGKEEPAKPAPTAGAPAAPAAPEVVVKIGHVGPT